MSGKNNINPGHYKIAGRDKQDDQARERMKDAHIETTKNAPATKKSAQDKKAR